MSASNAPASAAPANFDIRKFSTPQAAYVVAVTAFDDELKMLSHLLLMNGKDCREATWSDANEIAHFVCKLQEFRKEFSGEVR